MRNVRKGLAIMFGAAALMKLSGNETMREKFSQWGYGDEMRVVIGLSEATAATLLWLDQGRPASRAIVSTLMLGAAATHLKTSGERLHAIAPLTILAVTNVALDL